MKNEVQQPCLDHEFLVSFREPSGKLPVASGKSSYFFLAGKAPTRCRSRMSLRVMGFKAPKSFLLALLRSTTLRSAYTDPFGSWSDFEGC